MKMTKFGIPITHKVEGGHTLEEVKEALAKKFQIVSTKDFPSLEKIIMKQVIK